MGGSSPSPAPQSSTVTQVQQIPQYQQDFAQQNMNLAQSLGAQPYPTYNAPIIAGLDQNQWNGMALAANNATDYAPQLNQGINQVTNAEAMNPTASGDPSQNAMYGAGSIMAANPLAYSSGAVNNMVNSANGFALAGAGTAGGANGYGSAATGMAQQATASNMTPGVSNNVNGLTSAAAGMNPMGAASSSVNSLTGQAAGMNPVANTTSAVNALDPGNADVIQRYMNPYVQSALAPQLLQAKLNQNQQQAGINAQATGANAFGDARQGTQNALQDYYGQQTNAGIEAQGYNTAYTNAQNAALQQQNQQQQLGTLGVNEQNTLNALANTHLGLGTLGVNEQNALNNLAQSQIGLGNLGVSEQNAQTNAANTVLGAGNLQNATANSILGAGSLNVNAANAQTNMANTGVNEQNMMLNQQTAQQNYQKLLQAQQAQTAQLGMQSAQLGQQNQNDTLAAANAQYNVGNIIQQNQQSQLTAAYQQYMNQVNWPYQMLNVQESALSNTPYQIANASTVAPPDQANQNIAAFSTLAGKLSSAK